MLTTGIAVFAGGIAMTGGHPDLAWLRFASVAAFFAVMLLEVWERWAWKWPLLQRLPTVPKSVSGTWKGKLTSYWIDPATGSAPQERVAYLVVRQTYSTLTLTLLTEESKSSSSVASIDLSPDGSWAITQAYLNQPDMRVEHRSRMHRGAAVLDIIGSPAATLRGRYWTDRDSKGELEFLERRSTRVDDYRSASELFQ